MGEIGSIEIVIKGGRPWGFTLQGGAESRSAVTVAQIEPKGKADLQGSLKVGDHVLKINDVQCFSLADATQLIDCAFRTLTVHIWRSKKVVIVPNDTTQEKYRSSNSKNPCRQRHDEEDKYMQKILPDSLSYPGGYNKHAMIRKDIPKTQNFLLPCHSRQSSHEWVQYDHTEMSSLEDRALSPQDCCGQSLASDRSGAAAAVISQEHYEVNDSFNRHLRSPRSLTKDSGYETCAQVEHDYVNLEWMANVPYSKRSATVVSPGRYQVSSISEVFPTNERPHNHYGRQAMLSSSLASEKGSHQSSSTGSVSFPCSDYSDPFPPLRNSSASSSKYSESYNNLYSSTESLSSHTSKPESVHLRSSKSSLSLIRDSKSHIYDHQVSTSCQYSFVSPAQSTPNLNYCNKMAPLRVNKKTSVYEELASKSGFDFSPMIQNHRQPLQKAITKSEATISESHLPYASKVNVGSFPFVPENCDKTNIRAGYRNHCESIENESQVYYESKLPTGTPPPVPARDSSLRYRASLSHEKFPSWPVVPVENEINCSSVHSSGYRSNSWTEQTGCVKDFDGSYSRPKNNFQISTQQLHPVQERNHSGSNNRNAPTENKQLTKEAMQYSNEEDSTSLNISFNMLSKHLDSESSYEKCEKYINNHTPPDRNLNTPVPLSDDESVLTYIEKYDSDDYFQQSSNLYENVRRNGNHYHSTTPLLDMLRSESKDLSESCVSHRHVGPKSETSTYISSNSSSQETLKRYNSFSDLSSVHTFTRNDSPSLESEVNSIYDENLNKELKKGTSITYSNMSSSEASAQSSKTKHPSLRSNTAPRVIADASYEQKKTASSRAEIKRIPQGLDRSNKQCSRNYIGNRPDITTGNENSKEKSSLPYYACTKTYSEEANTVESKVRMVDYLYPSAQSEKERNNNNNTQVITPAPQKLHHEKSVHHFGGQKQYRRTVSVPGTITPRHLSDHGHYRHHRESSSVPSRNSTDNLETSNKFNQNLKALQKQAVLSFYHRQTMASKNFADKKARSSSFSHSREASTTEFSSVPVSSPTPSHNKYAQSSRSSSQTLSPASSCKSVVQPTNCEKHDEGIEFELRFNFQGKLTSSTNFCSQIERCLDKSYDKTLVSVSSTLNQEQDLRTLDVAANVRQNDKIVCVPNTPKQEVQDLRKSDVAENEKGDKTLVFVPSTLRQEQEDSKKLVVAENILQNNQVSHFSKEYINEASGKTVAVKLPQELTSGRKAFFQKTYNPNKSAVVKVISSDGETVVQNVITKNCGKTMSKPQVPPKRFYKAISVPPVMPEDNFTPSILAENEEAELLDIQMCHVALPLKATSVSPDLPPPPPPLNMERGTINEDDPFPPPPDPLDILVKDSEAFPQHYNANVSAVPMKEENKQSNLYSLALKDVSTMKVVDDVPTYKDEKTNIHNVPIRTSPNENHSHILSLHSNEIIESVSPEMSNSEKAYENEAIYVNLPFQLEVSEKSAVDNTPMAFSDTTPIISVTNTGTQTSETTPLLQQTNRISYLVSMYEDKQPRISTAKKEAKHTLSPTEAQPPVTSYNINKICSNKKIETSLAKDTGNFNFDSCASGGRPIVKSIKSLNDKINLPVTFSYFTTSEAKAKLLTRYCHSFRGNLIDNGDIECQKDDLVESISKKLDVMRLEQIKIKEEVEQNEELGRDVRAKFEKVAKPNEIEKYKTHVNELEKIVRILLSLSGRLTRAENALHILPKDDQSEEKVMLETKKNKLIEQLDDALQLKECIDKRSDVVSRFLNNYLSKEDYADYEHFIQMKPKLLIDSKEIDDNIQLGEEQLLALNGTFPGSHNINDELVNNNIDLTERVLGKH